MKSLYSVSKILKSITKNISELQFKVNNVSSVCLYGVKGKLKPCMMKIKSNLNQILIKLTKHGLDLLWPNIIFKLLNNRLGK